MMRIAIDPVRIQKGGIRKLVHKIIFCDGLEVSGVGLSLDSFECILELMKQNEGASYSEDCSRMKLEAHSQHSLSIYLTSSILDL